MTEEAVTFKICSLVPGYRGEVEVKSDAVPTGTFVLIRDVVDWYCRHLGRDVLSDDDYVLEIKTSANEQQQQNNNLCMSEIQIVAPDTEIVEMLLPQVCYICILDAQSIRPGSLLHRYPSSTLSYLASKVKRPTVYLGAGTLLILIGMVFVIVAAALSGPFITILDEAVVVSALTDCTVIGHYQWTRRQFPHSDVHPHQLAFFRSNVSLSHYSDNVTAAAGFLFRLTEDFYDASLVPRDTRLLLSLVHDLQVITSPQSIDAIISLVHRELERKKFKIVNEDVLNGTESSQLVWITTILWNGTEYEAQTQESAAGVLQLSSLSSSIAFPYHSSHFTDSGSELVNFTFQAANYSLYANTADCYGLQSSIARYLWNSWKAKNFSSEVDSTCYKNNSEQVIVFKDLEKYEACFENASSLLLSIPSNFTIKGTGGSSSAECESSVVEHLFGVYANASCACVGHCGLGGVCQPLVNASNHLTATGDYGVIAQNMGLNETEKISYKLFVAAVNETCSGERKSAADQDRRSCVESVFAKLALTSQQFGYGLTDHTWNVTFTTRSEPTNSSTYDALMAAVLTLKSGLFPNMDGQEPSRERQYAETGVLVVLGLASLISGIVVIGILVKKRTKKRPDSFSYHEFDY